MYNKTIDLELVRETVEKAGPGTRVYVGCDSEIVNSEGTRYVDYTVVRRRR